jgi:D-amino peptidase
MKIFLSADIEGITGTTNWDETDRTHLDYPEFREQMTAEVTAACEGAMAAGATEIWIKDAHGSARNLIAAKLPREAKLLRGWSGHPFMMVEGLDSSFDAMLLVGYHSRAGSNANPLAHTISGRDSYIKINDLYASEFVLNAFTAASVKVPTVFLAGDAGLCRDASDLIPAITTVAVKEGVGSSTINLHPKLAVEQIREAAQDALSGDLSKCLLQMPASYKVEIGYKDHFKALASSYYPGASLKDSFTLQFETDDYFEVLRLLIFVI